MPIELGALAGTVLVGWIASGNGRRERALASRIGELERRVAADTTTIGDLRRAALALRARNDRLDLSLTFLRNIARRLHGPDAEAGAQAALELIARAHRGAGGVGRDAGGWRAAPDGGARGLEPHRARSHHAGRDERTPAGARRWSWPKAAPTTATSQRPSPTPRAWCAA